ncbi:interferon-induced protein with tetratricopeptide repeats 5-like isoform X2 [Linepithema humile]|nr:PREDICTED: uncharacterized protein LOC105674646 [Linepithema humile]
MASSEAEKINIKTKLEKLHCPFTWEILNSVIKHSTLKGEMHDEDVENETSCALELLMQCLLKTYKGVISADKKNARKSIEKAEELLIQMQEHERHQTIRAVEHVFYATKSFFLYDVEELDVLEEMVLEEILNNIVDIEDFNNEELGALYGCQSVVWSFLNDFGMNKAIDTAKKAVEKNQDCALWHFILAKNLRRQRRSIHVQAYVTETEKNHFELAYAMSNENSVFGIYLLQMRMESFYKHSRDRDYWMKKAANEKQVLQTAKKILDTKPKNYKILLKLALIFLRSNEDERMAAKECLDAVRQMAPNNSTCMHYTAMFYQQCGDFREALKYYKKAADSNNFVAEMAYIEYGWETGELEPLPHLLRMLKKYEQSVKQRQISMLISVAITYYFIQNDISNAAEYFLKALTLDPLSNKFRVYYRYLGFNAPNILDFLNNKFCPLLERKNCQEVCLKIKRLLNVEAVTDLTEDFKSLSVDVKKDDVT